MKKIRHCIHVLASTLYWACISAILASPVPPFVLIAVRDLTGRTFPEFLENPWNWWMGAVCFGMLSMPLKFISDLTDNRVARASARVATAASEAEKIELLRYNPELKAWERAG